MTASDPRARIALFLERLRDMLPPRRAESILAEVSALIEDRLADDAAPHSPEAVDRALAALGPPEALAASLTGESEAADLATTRAHGRLLPVVFGAHLLLAVVLTIVGSTTAFVPGILGALPTSSPLATAFGVLGVFFVDVGLVVVAVRLVGRERVPALLHHVRLEMPGTRRDAVLSLVLLVLVVLLIDVPSVRDALFAIGTGEARAPILSEEAVRLIPAANGVLFLFALRHALLFLAGRERMQGLVVDAIASLAAAAFAVMVMTRDVLVIVPEGTGLSREQAATLADLLTRVAFVVCLIAGVLAMSRFVRRVLRIRELMSD